MSAPGRRIVLSNLPVKDSKHTEPAVEVVTEDLKTEELFDGMIKRTPIGTLSSVPTSNEGSGLPTIENAPGSGIVLPGGVNVYYLELAPNSSTPMHRTVSADYLIVNEGSPTLVSPKTSFTVENDKGTWDDVVESVLRPGDVAVQRGAAHAWKNATDSWVRMTAIVVDAKPSKAKSEELTEKWFQAV